MGKPRDKRYKEKSKGRTKTEDLKNKHTEWSEKESGKLERLTISQGENHDDEGKLLH